MGVPTLNYYNPKIPFTQEDKKIQQACPGICFWPVKGSGWAKPMPPVIESDRWEQPIKGWRKANFDGVSRGNPGPSRAGCIIQDWKGNVVALGATRLREGTNNVAKVSVALLVVKLARKLGIPKIHLEEDSQIIVQANIKNNIEAWHLQNIVKKVNEELAGFEEYKLTHVRHSRNVEADVLSEWVLSFIEIDVTCMEDFRKLNELDWM